MSKISQNIVLKYAGSLSIGNMKTIILVLQCNTVHMCAGSMVAMDTVCRLDRNGNILP